MSVATFPQEALTWLGRLPAGWQVKPLKHVVRVNPEALSDSADPDWRMTYADISSVSLGQGIVDAEEFAFADAPSRARRLVKAGDTLVSTVRTYLRAITLVREPPENLVASTGFAVLRPGSDIDPNFLGYFATSDAFVNAVVAQSVGVSYPATNASDIVRLPIAFPDIDQQQKIAAFLDRKTAEIDTLIAKKRRLLERLAEKRTALITRAVTKGLNPDAPLKDSGIEWLGQIPAHWETGVPIKYLVKMSGGMTPSTSNPLYWNGGIPWVSPKDMKQADLFDAQDHVTDLALSETGLSLLEPGSVLIVVRGMILAHSFPVAINRVPVVLNQDMKALKVGPRLSPEYFALLLRAITDVMLALVESSAHGTKALRTDRWKELLIALPPVEEQDTIVELVEKMVADLDSLEDATSKTIDKLEEYRSALITNAVTGQIKVA